MTCPMEPANLPPIGLSLHGESSIHRIVADLHDRREPFCLAILVGEHGSSPRGTGARMIVFPDGRTVGTVGGGAIEAHATVLCRAALEAGVPSLHRVDLTKIGMGCGGEVTLFVEPHAASPALFLLGGGHCAEALHRVIVPCGFRVQVVEDRAELLCDARFPGAAFHHAADWKAGIEALPFRDGDFAVIVTRGHKLDLDALVAVLAHPAKLAYVGMIGSRNKVAANFRAALERGIPEAKIDAVRSPIGLDTGGVTPAEIAVSIAAEMLAVRHGASGRPMREIKRVEWR